MTTPSTKTHHLQVRVKTHQPKTKILKEEDGVIHIALHAPPEENKANIELIKFLSKENGMHARIISGRTSKEKTIELY